jgi:hypothetical protein
MMIAATGGQAIRSPPQAARRIEGSVPESGHDRAAARRAVDHPGYKPAICAINASLWECWRLCAFSISGALALGNIAGLKRRMEK